MALAREDIIGRVVERVLQTPWRHACTSDYCDVVVALSGGLFVKLTNRALRPLSDAEIEAAALVAAEFRGPEGVRSAESLEICGTVVCDVVEPDRELHWDSCGFVLADGRLLCLGAIGASFGPLVLRPAELRPATVLRSYTNDIAA